VCQLTTRGLTLEQMVRVLSEPKNALLKQYKYLFNMEDVEFHITDGALRVGTCYHLCCVCVYDLLVDGAPHPVTGCASLAAH
jgi:hypothetical protein